MKFSEPARGFLNTILQNEGVCRAIEEVCEVHAREAERASAIAAVGNQPHVAVVKGAEASALRGVLTMLRAASALHTTTR